VLAKRVPVHVRRAKDEVQKAQARIGAQVAQAQATIEPLRPTIVTDDRATTTSADARLDLSPETPTPRRSSRTGRDAAVRSRFAAPRRRDATERRRVLPRDMGITGRREMFFHASIAMDSESST
jgi:hypothetical protein